MKKTLLFIAQLALGIGLLTFFYGKMHSSGQIDKFVTVLKDAAGNWPILAVGICTYLICMLLCSIRWNILLKSQDIHLPFQRIVALYFVGHFFSCFMPGATTGDIFKAIYIAREAPHKRTEVVATVFIDRIIGLGGMIILVVITMLCRLKFFLANPDMRLAMLFNFGLLAGAIVGSLLIFRQNLFEKWAFFRRISEKTSLGSIIKRAYDAFHLCMNHRGILTSTIAISVVNHLVFIICAYFLGMGLKINLGIIDYISVFPIINAVACLPLTPGSIGTRDAAAKYLLGVLGVAAPQALALSLLVYLTTLVWGFVGGIIYFFYSSKVAKTIDTTST